MDAECFTNQCLLNTSSVIKLLMVLQQDNWLVTTKTIGCYAQVGPYKEKTIFLYVKKSVYSPVSWAIGPNGIVPCST